jgi:BirA family transcriptional regulator, biotin operon repressor / biotin---[acetyl-CoA-carboxylase] ligase
MLKKKIIGTKIIALEEVDSTNRYLAKFIHKENIVSEGLVITARAQLSGKGQGKNSWESEAAKNIAMSFLIKPVMIPASDNFAICIFVSLAVRDFVNFYTKELITIKWPNDIYYKNLKIAGILIENTVLSNVVSLSIIGIGININQEIFMSNAPNPVSLKNINGKTYNLSSCLKKLCSFLDSRYAQLKSGNFPEQKKQYLENLYGWGNWIKLTKGNTVFTARIKGISPYGHLIVEEENGSVSEFEQKEIGFVLP